MKISFSTFIISFFTLIYISKAQLPYPLPAAQDTSQFGKNIQRTMKLLATSTPSKRNTVKILVYGQSIAKQEWSDTVRKYLRMRFPHANIIMINRSIGGCWAGCLQDPMEYDTKPFYPDLIMFDVYGWNGWGGQQGTQYENIIKYFREHTTAEVAMQNHHEGGTDTRNDNSDFIRLRNTYGVELIDVRTPWLKYMSDNSITGTQLTSDGTHLNDRGNFLMARLWLPYLQYKPNLATLDGTNLVKTYKVGVDVFWENGKLSLPFNGNKIEIVTAPNPQGGDSAKVFIDGIRPSQHTGTTMFLRPNDTQDTIFKHYSLYDWPWQTSGIMKFEKPNTPAVPEQWSLEFLSYSSTTNFSYKITGSKTGLDGNGSYSNQVFTSTSKIVIFDRSKFWFSGSPSPLPLAAGFKINWEARAFFRNTFIPPLTVASAVIDSVVTLAQGLSNTNHLLELVSTGSKNTPISEIRVYQPYFNRVANNTTQVKPNIVVSKPVIYCTNKYASIKNAFTDIQNTNGKVSYWSDSATTIPIAKPEKITITGTYFIKKIPISISAIPIPDVKPIKVEKIDCNPVFSVVGIDTCSNLNIDLTTIPFREVVSFSGTYQYITDTTDISSYVDDPTMVNSPGSYYISKTTDSLTYGFAKIATIKDCAVPTTPSPIIAKKKASPEFNIYPNPSENGVFHISGIGKENSLRVYDIIGNLVLSKNIDSNQKSIEIDLGSMPSGIYILKTAHLGSHKLILK